MFRIADRVTVLRDGRRVRPPPVADTTPAALVQHIVGRSLDGAVLRRAAAAAAETLLAVDGLRDATVRARSSFDARTPARSSAWSACAAPATTRVGRALFGDVALHAGRDRAGGRAVPLRRSPADAMAARLGFVSSKRGEESLAPNLDACARTCS